MCSLVHIGNIVNAQKTMKRWKLEGKKGGASSGLSREERGCFKMSGDYLS